MSTTLTPDELRRELASATPPLVIDVRRADDRKLRPQGIPGADWRDPLLLEDWAGGIPASAEVAVYCVRGGSVSKNVQDQLARRGVKARYVEGGLAAWSEGEALRADPDAALLLSQGVPEKGLAHAVLVAQIALAVARDQSPQPDLDLVRRGALLHDLGKVRDMGNLHGVAGAELGRELGLPEEVLDCIEKHVRHGVPLEQAEGYGLPRRDFSFTRVEERIVSYADKLADILAAGLAAGMAEARERFPEILAANASLAKDEATLARYSDSWKLLEQPR
ncbi:MAG: HDIG domain-containing protein [Humidesulfovibrio sp.]|uniref:HDIG domain-containing metalloprotein n=1 Tax=Humidesulfovibrio sp. TaxID=2910988 RepID=UPI002734B366|nr:HDIG domain-containing metalloprotein [Humidesulfovibrio sp.]MDP2847591.1 HDIG domain-containing protein [Humidesulfovibrio sp.]